MFRRQLLDLSHVLREATLAQSLMDLTLLHLRLASNYIPKSMGKIRRSIFLYFSVTNCVVVFCVRACVYTITVLHHACVLYLAKG